MFYFILFHFFDLHDVLAAIALSKTLDYYADAETFDVSSTATETSNDGGGDENKKNDRNLYDKASKTKTVSERRTSPTNNQDTNDNINIVSSNVKTIVVVGSKEMILF